LVGGQHRQWVVAVAVAFSSVASHKYQFMTLQEMTMTDMMSLISSCGPKHAESIRRGSNF
jgi:hypothetical protein